MCYEFCIAIRQSLFLVLDNCKSCSVFNDGQLFYSLLVSLLIERKKLYNCFNSNNSSKAAKDGSCT